MVDFERFVEPIDAESPCGPDCEYDNEFLALSQAVVGKPEQQFGDTVPTRCVREGSMDEDDGRLRCAGAFH